MLSRPRIAFVIATGPFALAAAVGTMGSACNALSGIGEFAVVSEAGTEGSEAGASEGAVSVDGGFSGAGEAAVDALAEAGDADREGDAIASGDGESDATSGTGDGAADAPEDAGQTVDAAVDAPSDAPSDAPGACGTSTITCSGSCPTMHFNGISQFFYDCVEAGTINLAQAFEACAAFAGDAGACTNDPITCAAGSQVCSSGYSSCACWRYIGTNAGKVGNSGSTTCNCLGSTSPTWY